MNGYRRLPSGCGTYNFRTAVEELVVWPGLYFLVLRSYIEFSSCFLVLYSNYPKEIRRITPDGI